MATRKTDRQQETPPRVPRQQTDPIRRARLRDIVDRVVREDAELLERLAR